MAYDTQPFCSMVCPEITADFVADENLYPVNSTLYEHSTRPMKLCVPLFTPPDIVLTVPDVLRTPFYQHADVLLSPFMQCGVKCLDDFLSEVSGKPLNGGYIVVVQTHGRNG